MKRERKPALGALPDGHAEVARLRFGIERPTHTLREIAERLDLSIERIRRIDREVIAMLAQGPHAKDLLAHLA